MAESVSKAGTPCLGKFTLGDDSRLCYVNRRMPAADAFYAAMADGDEEKALVLLRDDPSLAQASGMTNLDLHHRHGPPLLLAAELGLSRLVESLLQTGLEPCQRGCLGGNALHWAAWHGHLDLVQLLLKHGLPPDQPDPTYDCTPLFWAVHGYSALGTCPRRHQLAVVETLLLAGANPKARNHKGTSAIDLLTKPDEEPMRNLLRRFGAF